MEIKDAYNAWSEQYDTNVNKTRDLEKQALRDLLANVRFDSCLELGCGTGKNTEWLFARAKHVTSVDFSHKMLAKAKQKIQTPNVRFIQADISEPWHFAHSGYDLISFSLVLEHIEHLDAIFEKACQCLSLGGHIYIGELHPFKQYTGSKARFETESGTQALTCFDHHVTDFTDAALKHGLQIAAIKEYFDDGEHIAMPRILALIFRKR